MSLGSWWTWRRLGLRVPASLCGPESFPSGRAGGKLFAVATALLPAGKIRPHAVPALLDVAQVLAVQELLQAKSLMDLYEAEGLTDATTLRRAVERVAGEMHVVGTLKGAAHQAVKEGDYAVACWKHVHDLKLASPPLYLDAATCFIELKQPDQALPLLQEACDAFAEAASDTWLARCGHLARRVGEAGEELAVKAYDLACERLRETVTGKEAHPW